MLREDDKLTEALIQIIQSLPETKKEKIARNIMRKRKSKVARNLRSSRKGSFAEMSSFLDSLGSKLPRNYKFNRDEANER